MAKEMEPRGWAELEHAGDQGMDQAALIAAILAQNAGPAAPVVGPEWASQVRPPAIPGTIQDKYAKMVTPIRAALMFGLWVTWNWKYGAFVAVVLALIALLIKTR
ncbi:MULTISPECIES: hypothetical protein [unclassified Nonomuraea]|uniref:hypothetical protein n=1 Tax=unclassified Nonomuraea TaxID=2593643 RepID=UPI0033FEE81D